MKYERLCEAVKKEDWVFVDKYLTVSVANHLMPKLTEDNLFDESDDVRDLVATIFMVSDEIIDDKLSLTIESLVLSDDYDIVRYRLAMALYKRGNHTSLIVQAVKNAVNNPDVGDLAKFFLKAA